MFFDRFVMRVIELLPEQGKLHRYFTVLFDYYGCKQKVIAWHRAELEKLDSVFRIQQASLKLIAAREKARAEGIGPLDPKYPDIFDFYKI